MPLDDPRVSVIMSVYNGERFLPNSVVSILSQSFKDFEFIIVDDCSNDGTAEMLGSIDDPRIKLIINELNLGLTRSLNKAAQTARGTYLARMDADDISLSHRFETQVAYLDNNPECAVVGSCYFIIDEHDQIIHRIGVLTDDASIKEGLPQQNWFGHGSVMMRREAFQAVGGYDNSFKYSQDYDLWLRMSERFTLANLEECLYCWRDNSAGISRKKQEEQRQYAARAVEGAIQRSAARILPIVSAITPACSPEA